MDDQTDFLDEPQERRQFKRISSNVFFGIRVHGSPLPPYFGDPIDGFLVDLSAGGMGIQSNAIIPKKTKLHMELTFPDRTVLESDVIVRRVGKAKEGHFIGIEFLTLPDYMRKKIENMTHDYLACEERISRRVADICKLDCTFFNICRKVQKKVLENKLDNKLQIKLEEK